MFLDDCPKLQRRTLIAAGALGPGQKTRSAWPQIAGAPSIEVTGGDHAFTIAGDDSEVRMVVTKRGMTCPRCGAGCYSLVFCDEWGCWRCNDLEYRS